jgi:hypothetical protein
MSTVPGTHRFLHLLVCDGCGLRRDRETRAAEVEEHVRECQPGLFPVEAP